ncbi:MAG TPA: CHAT domain-containing protein [Thermoanaerobaculia bacterium]|nr:CHAT domain-containing protein [Thermoanaerobaculia bacterium]
MSDDVQIRLVHVEFLRPGPPHNQLLSPLTQYLAISGDSGAGVVTVPYEQAEFSRRLKQLRYDSGDPEDRLAMLHSTGVEMSRILGAVPGLAGALTMDANHQGTLIQLRITLSASELAMLPFELAKAPVSATNTAENWLSIQTRPPVCVTRNIRTVSPEGVVWPDQPRILFISGNPGDVPYEQHRKALLKAIEPFQYPDEDDVVVTEEGREQGGRLLTILVDPTLARVLRECRENEYTHVHILTHGDLNEASPDSYGLVMRGEDGSPEVVSGDQFATALASVHHRPTVVTVASCDSGNVNQVAQPGASFAHALHQSGIPLVLASQFPLSKPGSVPLAATLYDGLLWGKNPLVLLRELRAELHTVYTSKWHDWASLVVYEALPQALNEQLEKLRYFQTKRAINATLERIDRAVKRALEERSVASLEKLHKEIESAVGRLPLKGPYSAECIGIRASARKRLAQAAFNTPESPRDAYDLLEQAYIDYKCAADSLLVISEGPAQRVATLHWLLVQLESLDMILGREGDDRRWTAAHLSAEMYRHHLDTEQRAWAHGSLAELFLVKLGKAGLNEEDREKHHQDVLQHIHELVKLYPLRTEFPVKSTRRQFERYADWWGSQQFEDGLKERGLTRRAPWDGQHGVTQVAKEVVKIMQRNLRPPVKPPSSGSAGGNGGGAPEPPPKPSGGKPGGGATLSRRARTKPFFDITMLPAGHGDSLWIEYGQNERDVHRVLVDCGTQQTARELLKRVAALPKREQFFDLFILSHIDSDHIGGALPFFKAVRDGLRFGDVWFNGWRHLSDRLSARQGEMFSTAIQDLELPWNVWMDGGAIVIGNGKLPTSTLPGGMKLTLLSPTPKQLQKLAPVWTRELKRYALTPGARMDYSQFLKGKPSTSTDLDELAETPFSSDPAAPNGSSIAVLAEYEGAVALLGADAHAPVLTESLGKLLPRGKTRLKIDAFKVSHHASQNNVSRELVSMLDCPRFLVSSNGAHFNHPDREAIARIIKYRKIGDRKPELIFNYRTPLNDVWEGLQDRYGFTAHYPAEEPGQVVSLLPE